MKTLYEVDRERLRHENQNLRSENEVMKQKYDTLNDRLREL